MHSFVLFSFKDTIHEIPHSFSVSTAKTCEPVEIPNAMRDPERPTIPIVYQLNEEVRYDCNDNYRRAGGDFVRTCIGINEWSGTEPVCQGNFTNGLNFLLLYVSRGDRKIHFMLVPMTENLLFIKPKPFHCFFFFNLLNCKRIIIIGVLHFDGL